VHQAGGRRVSVNRWEKMVYMNIHRGRALRIAVGIMMLELLLAGGARALSHDGAE
jgi:hypothetical protein